MQQVSCSPVHSEGNLEALKAASGAVQCSRIPELFAKVAARQLLRDPSPSPPCTIHRFPPAKRPWKPIVFPDRWDPHVTQSPRNVSVAVGMEGSSTVRHSRSPASRAFPHLRPITAFCRWREWQEETPYFGNGWACSEAQQHLGQILQQNQDNSDRFLCWHTKFPGQKIWC